MLALRLLQGCIGQITRHVVELDGHLPQKILLHFLLLIDILLAYLGWCYLAFIVLHLLDEHLCAAHDML